MIIHQIEKDLYLSRPHWSGKVMILLKDVTTVDSYTNNRIYIS